ncbi:hypothetical protein [Chroococcidiopsis sp. CCNUC1]|uniref:hypothetical protein n=1 Tax=Chroococcidiopsis sp. CCNUC1 TaxID=2653189 RepID=UPI002021F1F1|nr:hypothetical protein [Chroococcidiopsis sp. CCNUC1]URD53779.1 hypothetical protein M5J74_32305 [Chroococcidiopsis sp. CCNUC1]
MRSLQSPSLSVSPDNVHLFNSNLGAYMDFEQLVINQPQKCAIALEFEISGSVNCEWCSQLAQTVASFVEQLLHLTHPSVKINYSICASAKKTSTSVQLPPL